MKHEIPPREQKLFLPIEIKIIQMICKELTSKQIAQKLNSNRHVPFAPRSIELYRKRILKKMKVKNSIGLALYAVRHGIIPLSK